MTLRDATRSPIRSIPLVIALALVAACSRPKPESSAPAQSAQEPVAEAAPAPTPSQASPPTPAERPPVDQGAQTPAETPVTAPPPAPAATPVANEAATPKETAHDALKEMEEKEQRRVAYEQDLTKLAAARDAAAEEVTRREKDLLAFKNPYLARPKLKPDEAEQINGMGGAERASWAEGRVTEAKAALEAAQKAYDDAKANPPN